jgi:hypothetical protein
VRRDQASICVGARASKRLSQMCSPSPRPRNVSLVTSRPACREKYVLPDALQMMLKTGLRPGPRLRDSSMPLLGI